MLLSLRYCSRPRRRALSAALLLLGLCNARAEQACIPTGQWNVPAQQRNVSTQQVLRNAAQRKVILLGEHHDNAEHHRWQLQTVAALAVQHTHLVLGFEMFPRRLQPILDRWVNGELGEEEFLKAVDWDTLWSFDAGYYLPLFHFARMNRIPMRALNVDRALFSRVTAGGWEAVPLDEREGLSVPATASKGYLRFLAQSFLGHNPPDATHSEAQRSAQFLRFVQGQQVWDRAMAEAISAVARRPQAPTLVAFMGSWHMVNRYGVVEQLKDLKVADVVVWVPWDAHFECAQLNASFADAVFGIQTE